MGKFFFVKGYELGASQAGRLQYDNNGTWTDVGNGWIADNTTITCNSNKNIIPVDFSIFIPGNTYCFRLIDKSGSPISNVICIQVPGGIDQDLLNTDNTILENTDDGILKNINP